MLVTTSQISTKVVLAGPAKSGKQTLFHALTKSPRLTLERPAALMDVRERMMPMGDAALSSERARDVEGSDELYGYRVAAFVFPKQGPRAVSAVLYALPSHPKALPFIERLGRGIDVLLFVAHSDATLLEENRNMWETLQKDPHLLAEDSVRVLVVNHRDANGAAPVEQVVQHMKWDGPVTQAVAVEGVGVDDMVQAILGSLDRHVSKIASMDVSTQESKPAGKVQRTRKRSASTNRGAQKSPRRKPVKAGTSAQKKASRSTRSTVRKPSAKRSTRKRTR